MFKRIGAKARAEDRSKCIDSAFSQLLGHIDNNGFTKASLTYEWYSASWFRDSSMVVLGLLDCAEMYSNKNPEKYSEAVTSAGKILDFMWLVAAENLHKISAANTLDKDSEHFKALDNHLPARVNPKGDYFSIESNGRNYSDQSEAGKDSWLRQYDSIPLIFIATDKFIEAFGQRALPQRAVENIRKAFPESVKYISRVYDTPCSNAWELDWSEMHSYTVASISGGMKSAARVAEKLGIAADQEFIANKAANIDKFLGSTFIREGILCKSAKINGKLAYTDRRLPVDASEIFIFSLFKPALPAEVEKNTIAKIESDLFSGNTLPIRFEGDTYFTGGRWLLCGLEFARYCADKGNIGKSGKIIKYIESRYSAYGMRLPEQEIINVASPKGDPDHYLEKNGNSPISDLAWSEAEYLRAVCAYSKRLQVSGIAALSKTLRR